MKKYKAIIFDWDGTLMNSLGSIVSAMTRALTDLGMEVHPPHVLKGLIGRGVHDVLYFLVPDRDPEKMRQLHEAYRNYFKQSQSDVLLYDGVAEVIPKLQSQGYMLAIATSRRRQGLDQELASAGLAPYFIATRAGDEVAHGKPHPETLELILEELVLEPKEAIMVGDTTYDLDMAKALNMPAIAVSHGAHDEETLVRAGPMACINCISDIQSHLCP